MSGPWIKANWKWSNKRWQGWMSTLGISELKWTGMGEFNSDDHYIPASGCFQISQLFASGGQSIGASTSASVLLMNIHGWFPLELTIWISLQSKGLSRVFSSTTVWKHQFFGTQPSFTVHLSHPYITIGKTIALTIWTFVGKVTSLLLNMLSRFIITFLPRYLLISWLQSL